MDITIFESVTTESALRDLEVEGEKYDGLYVDMENAPERKYVKDKAAFISGLLKKLDRVRIDAAKDYKVEVEKQAQAIKSRLQDANSNFQLLIDDYAIERKKILDAEKARKQAILDAEQKELDHEMALLINKTYEFDKAELLREQEKQQQIADEEFEAMREEEKARAEANQILITEAMERDKVYAENARLADVEHVRFINRLILKEMHGHGLPEKESIEFIKTLARKQLPQLTINY